MGRRIGGFTKLWQNAAENTAGFRRWGRELVSATLVGLFAYLALRHWESKASAVDAVIVVIASVAVTLVVVPASEFVWNFAAAPLRIARNERDQALAQAAELRAENNALRFLRLRTRLRDDLAAWLQDGTTILAAGYGLERPEEVPEWITDCHSYQDTVSDWLEENIGYAECIRFRDLHGPPPSLPLNFHPLNAEHAEHVENVARWTSNLREIIREYPPIR
jgi:hypothetical protein